MNLRKLPALAVLGAAGSLSFSAVAAPGPFEQSVLMAGLWFTDSRLFTGDGDWAIGMSKMECGVWNNPNPEVYYNDPLQINAQVPVGLSGKDDDSNYLQTTGLLCATSNVISVNYLTGTTQIFREGADTRLDGSTGDWAYGYDKGECARDEVVTGISFASVQTSNPYSGINRFRCSHATLRKLTTTPLVATSCVAVDFNMHDGYDGFAGSHRSDWEYGDDKGNCGANRYIKGFSIDHNYGSNYKPNKVLCCGAQPVASGVVCDADEQCASGVCSSGRCL